MGGWRRFALVLGDAQESLELTLGHAVTELGAARTKASQLALAQPAPDCLGRRPEPLGYFTHCKKSLFIHGVPVGLFTGALPVTAPKRNCQVVRSMVSDLQRDLSCINATTMPGTNAGS